MLLNRLGQFESFFKVLDYLTFSLADFCNFTLISDLVTFVFVDLFGELEAELEVLIGQFINFDLSHEVAAFRLCNNQLDTIFGLPIVR